MVPQYFYVNLSGGRPIKTASSIASQDFTLDSFVEVAISAMILSFFGSRLLIFPMLAKAVRNSSLLNKDLILKA